MGGAFTGLSVRLKSHAVDVANDVRLGVALRITPLESKQNKQFYIHTYTFREKEKG